MLQCFNCASVYRDPGGAGVVYVCPRCATPLHRIATRRIEKTKAKKKDDDKALGALLGAGIGAAMGGPPGALVGGLLGLLLTEKKR